MSYSQLGIAGSCYKDGHWILYRNPSKAPDNTPHIGFMSLWSTKNAHRSSYKQKDPKFWLGPPHENIQKRWFVGSSCLRGPFGPQLSYAVRKMSTQGMYDVGGSWKCECRTCIGLHGLDLLTSEPASSRGISGGVCSARSAHLRRSMSCNHIPNYRTYAQATTCSQNGILRLSTPCLGTLDPQRD